MQTRQGQTQGDLVQTNLSQGQGQMSLSQGQTTPVQSQFSQSLTPVVQSQGQFSQGQTEEIQSQGQNIQTQGQVQSQVPQGKSQPGREFKERVPFFEQLENTLQTISGRNTPVAQSPAKVSAITTTVQSTQPTMSVCQSEAPIASQSEARTVQPMDIEEKSTDSEDLQIVGFEESPLKKDANLQQQNLNLRQQQNQQLQQQFSANQIGGHISSNQIGGDFTPPSVHQSEPSFQPNTIAHAMDSLIRKQLATPPIVVSTPSASPIPGAKPSSGPGTPIQLSAIGSTPTSTPGTPGSKPSSGRGTPLQLTATGMTMSQVMDQLTGKTQGNLIAKSGKCHC